MYCWRLSLQALSSRTKGTQQINEAKVLMTLFDGEVVFQQPSDTQ